MEAKDIHLEQGKNRIRVLIVSPSLSEGGSEKFAARLASYLVSRGFVVSIAIVNDREGYEVPEDVDVLKLGRKSRWSLFRVIVNLRKMVRRQDPHIVFGVVDSVNRLIGMSFPFSRRFLSVMRVADNLNNVASNGESKLLAYIIGHLSAFSMRRADLIIANSKGLLSQLEEKSVVEDKRLFLSMNSLNLSDQPPKWGRLSGEGWTLISVGRLSKQKRYDLLLDAIARLQEEMKINYLILGQGPEEASIRRMIEEKGLLDSVELTGFVSNPVDYLARADLFLMASDHEGLPNALIEAQSIGIPAVSTDCDFGPREVIEDGITGSLVPVLQP